MWKYLIMCVRACVRASNSIRAFNPVAGAPMLPSGDVTRPRRFTPRGALMGLSVSLDAAPLLEKATLFPLKTL